MHTKDPAHYRDLIDRIAETDGPGPDFSSIERRRAMRMLVPSVLPTWFGYLDKILLTSMIFRMRTPSDPVVAEIVWTMHPTPDDVAVMGLEARGHERGKSSDGSYFRTREFDRLMETTMHAAFGRSFGKFKVGDIWPPPPFLLAEINNGSWSSYVESTVMPISSVLHMALTDGTARTMLLRAASAHAPAG